MKKVKMDKSQLNQTISFESKKTSKNKHTLLPQKRPPLQNIQNQMHQIHHHQIKTEQSHIKNDIQNGLQRQQILSGKSIELKSGSIAKAKCQSNFKKDIKKVLLNFDSVNQKNQNISSQENEDFFIILNFEKNQQCANNKIIASKASKDIYQNTKKAGHPFDNIDLRTKQIHHTNETVNRRLSLDIDLKETKLKIDEQLERLSLQNYLLSQKVSELNSQLCEKQHIILQKQEHLSAQISRNKILSDEKNSIEQQFIKQRLFFSQRINELTFHNHNLATINLQLINDKDIILRQVGFNKESELSRKIQFLEKDIRQYQKREDIYSKQIQRLHLDLQKIIKYDPLEQLQLAEQQKIKKEQDQSICKICKQICLNKPLLIENHQRQKVKTIDEKQRFDSQSSYVIQQDAAQQIEQPLQSQQFQ